MGFMGSMLGQGNTGASFKAQSADIMTPATVGQATTAYNQTQDAIAQQKALVEALQGQGGIQNQSNVFNQLQGVAAGTGPNPAQAQLAQATGANVANQAALMAGQRGAGANAGLLARQAAMQGSNAQQQAAGQAASLQAQQSLGALNQMGGIAGQQVGQQQQATGALNQYTQGQQQNLLNSIAATNQARVGMQSNMNTANAQLATEMAKGQQGALMGGISGLGSALGPLMSTAAPLAMGAMTGGASLAAPAALGALGGGTMMAAEGGAVTSSPKPDSGPRSFAGKHLSGVMMASDGEVPALVSPGEVYLPPEKVKQVAKGKANPVTDGEKIPGKPKFPGNNYANDTVPKTLQEGGIVIPNAVLQSKDPHGEAQKFVAAVLAKHNIKASKRKK